MSEAVDYLDWAANHFVHRDWDYTRTTHIKSIRYDLEYDPRQTLRHRISIGWHFLTRSSKRHGIIYKGSLWWRVRMFFYCLQREKNLPDGVLDGGNVITHWEETGEYLQLVQPSVGALLVNFLKSEPEHPHAKLIIAELERIHQRYEERARVEAL